MSEDYVTTHEIVVAARGNVTQTVWNYITGAAETESTMRRNRHSLDSLGFRPRILCDVSDIDPSTTFLGHKLRIPVMLAPIGSLQSFTAEGGIDVVKAAAEFGIVSFTSTVTQPSLEEIASATDHPKFFQIYIRGDQDWVDSLIDRAVGAGFAALALTVDSAYYGRRERQMITRWLPPSKRNDDGREWQAALTWEKMAAMKQRGGGLPFMLKGVQTAEDALKAVEHGVDVIYVSNHGGRQLDHGQGTIDILSEVVEAVGDRADVIMDGGFMRGTDILKAIALGAKAVGLGRFQAYALAAGGVPTLVKALELLEAEMKNAMGLIGITSLDQLDRSYVTRAAPVTAPNELGAFPLLPEDFRL